MRLTAILLLPVLVACPLLGACDAGRTPPADAPSADAYRVSGDQSPAPSGATPLAAPEGTVRGTFLPYTPGATAITYDPAVVPPGATVQLATDMTTDGVTVRLAVTGMIPRRAYGAHLHTKPCTAMPDQAGPHYQHNPDPAAAVSPPSVDPSYANPHNEVWLDFTADAQGAASVTSAEAWAFDETHPPRSLVVHSGVTRTTKGVAGMAGPRVACLTLAP